MNNQEPFVVVVGAGLAGLSAACKIFESGHKNVKILEAKGEAGGRIKSFYVDGHKLDIGARWLHGDKSVSIYPWLKNQNISTKVSKAEDRYFPQGANRSFTEEQLPEGHLLEELEKLRKELYEARGSHKYDEYASVGHFFQKLGHDLDNQNLPEQDERRRKCIQMRRAILNKFCLEEMIDNACDDLFDLSMHSYTEWMNFDDGVFSDIEGGWQAVVDVLTTRIGPLRIEYNTEVENITYSSDGVLVKHSRGELKCDHVIVTFSLGVLRDLPANFFTPPMDELRRDAYKKLGFGIINKLFVELYEECNAFKESQGHQVRYNFLAAKNLAGRGEQVARFEGDLPPFIYNGTLCTPGFEGTGNPRFIMAYVGGQGAADIERMIDEELMEATRRLVAIFMDLPPFKLPKIKALHRSCWATDRNIKGAYSYESVRSFRSDKQKQWQDLWSPLSSSATGIIEGSSAEPRVLFAGEATAGPMHATAHGAMESGWREASRLIKHWEKKTRINAF